MSLETFTGKVSDLVPTNPTGSDPRSQGDDHLRGIKQTIIGQSINCQIGQSATPANNFTLSVPAAPDGTMKLARGNAGATTQDIMTVAADGTVAFPAGKVYAQGEVIQQQLYTDAGGAMPATIANVTVTTKLFTPRSTNSKILVSVSFYGSARSGGTFFNTQLAQVSPIPLNVGDQNSNGLTAVGNQFVGGLIQEGIVENTSLDTRGFQLWANNQSGAGGAISYMVWKITEVQN
jgi:hypothetical protein